APLVGEDGSALKCLVADEGGVADARRGTAGGAVDQEPGAGDRQVVGDDALIDGDRHAAPDADGAAGGRAVALEQAPCQLGRAAIGVEGAADGTSDGRDADRHAVVPEDRVDDDMAACVEIDSTSVADVRENGVVFEQAALNA